MVEERRTRTLTDSELDGVLAEAFAPDPSPDFVARVRGRLAGEGISRARPLSIFAATAVLAAAAIVFVVVTLDRGPDTEQPRVRIATAIDRDRGEVSGRPPAVGMAAPVRRATAPADRRPANRGRDEFQKLPSADVLIPAAEQQALRRLLDRPPTVVLRFAASTDDEPVVVNAIAITPLSIDPLSPR